MSTRSRNVLIGVAMLVAIGSRVAHAEIEVGESVEWIAVDSDLIVRCRPIEVVGDDSGWSRATFEVRDTLKGPASSRLTVRVDANDRDVTAWQGVGDERIVFFTRTERDLGPDAQPDQVERARYPFRLREAWQWQRVGPIGEARRLAFTADGRVLREPSAMEAALRAAIASPATPRAPEPVAEEGFAFDGPRQEHGRWSYRMDAPHDVERALWNRSAVFLIVPFDERLERRAIERYDAGDTSLSILRVLRYFRDVRTAAIFRAALAHGGDGTSGYVGLGRRWYYDSRALAYATLARWGEIVPRPAIAMPEDGYRRVTLATIVGVLVALIVLLLASHAVLKRLGRASLVDAACLSSLLLACTFVAFVWRDPQGVRELTFATAGARYWAWLDARGATVVRAAAWPEPVDPSYGVFDKAAAPYGRWDDDWAADGWRHAGVRWMTGPMQPLPSNGHVPPASSAVGLSVPAWAIALTLLLPPAVRATSLARSTRRRRSRRLRGACVTCGYDLRGGRARCPECGAIGYRLAAT